MGKQYSYDISDKLADLMINNVKQKCITLLIKQNKVKLVSSP